MKVSVYIPYNCCKSSIIDKSTEAYNVNIISKCIKREERDISDRSHWLYNAAIWCRNHEVRVHILGAGKRPKMLPKKWFWYDMENDHWSQKHILAWKNGIVDTDADYSVFTDSDISLDVDTMVEDLNKTNLVSKEPLYWGGAMGEEIENWAGRYGLNSNDYLIKNKIEKHWAGYVVSVINKNATNKILSNKKLIDIVYTKHKNKFIDSDSTVPSLVWLNGIKSIQAQGCENRNFFLIFSKLVNRGKLWHIHFCLTSPLVDTRKLASLLKDGPHDSIELCIDKVIKGLSRNKIRVKDYINRKFDLGYFFCPWVHAPPFKDKGFGVLEILSKSTCKLTYNTGITLNGSIQEIDNGFIISFTDRTITCKWTYKMEDGTILLIYYETILPDKCHIYNSAIQAMFPK